MISFPDLKEFLKTLENLRPLCPHVARVTKTCPPPEASLVPQILADRWCAPCYGPRGCRGFCIVYACAAASGLQVVLCLFRFPSGLDFVNGNKQGRSALAQGACRGAGKSLPAPQGDVASQGCFCVGLACLAMSLHSGEVRFFVILHSKSLKKKTARAATLFFMSAHLQCV